MIELTKKMFLTERLVIAPSWVSNGVWLFNRSELPRYQNACLASALTAEGLMRALGIDDPCVSMQEDEIKNRLTTGEAEFNLTPAAIVTPGQTKIQRVYQCRQSWTTIDIALLDAFELCDHIALGAEVDGGGYSNTPLWFTARDVIIMCCKGPIDTELQDLRGVAQLWKRKT